MQYWEFGVNKEFSIIEFKTPGSQKGCAIKKTYELQARGNDSCYLTITQETSIKNILIRSRKNLIGIDISIKNELIDLEND